MQIYDHDAKAWYPCFEAPSAGQAPQPITHVHILYFSTFIMLAVYATPMIVRPIDFCQNAVKYLVGWVTYMFMMPIFITVMNIYAMCNLHDISWGNRPAAADSAQLSIHAKKQAAMLDNYKMFRVNAFCLWAMFNILFIIFVEQIMNDADALALNDGHLGPIEVFSVIMAGMALFRIIFGSLHVLRMKCQLSSKKFKLQQQNLKQIVNTMQGNLDESAYLLKDYLAQEERDQADDDLMATYSPLDMKIKKEMAIKAQKE